MNRICSENASNDGVREGRHILWDRDGPGPSETAFMKRRTKSAQIQKDAHERRKDTRPKTSNRGRMFGPARSCRLRRRPLPCRGPSEVESCIDHNNPRAIGVLVIKQAIEQRTLIVVVGPPDRNE